MNALECTEWAVEVDTDHNACSLSAQEDFIVDFISPLFMAADSDEQPLCLVKSMHFTRIFNPARDKMGAYVRLRVFCDTADAHVIGDAIDSRLTAHFGDDLVLQRKRTPVDWNAAVDGYGGAEVAPLFRDYLDRTGRTVCELLQLKRGGFDVETVLWPWTHFYFNAARGIGRSVVEIAPGAVTGFWENI